MIRRIIERESVSGGADEADRAVWNWPVFSGQESEVGPLERAATLGAIHFAGDDLATVEFDEAEAQIWIKIVICWSLDAFAKCAQDESVATLVVFIGGLVEQSREIRGKTEGLVNCICHWLAFRRGWVRPPAGLILLVGAACASVFAVSGDTILFEFAVYSCTYITM